MTSHQGAREWVEVLNSAIVKVIESSTTSVPALAHVNAGTNDPATPSCSISRVSDSSASAGVRAAMSQTKSL